MWMNVWCVVYMEVKFNILCTQISQVSKTPIFFSESEQNRIIFAEILAKCSFIRKNFSK